MLNKNAKKWVAALRSGKYKQGRGALKKDGKYCCLGVACEISGLNKWYGRLPEFRQYYMLEAGVLPLEVQKWLGLNDRGGGYCKGNRSLTQDNDKGVSFKEIASIIESEPEGLFVKSKNKLRKK